jgi:hypothetical protein
MEMIADITPKDRGPFLYWLTNERAPQNSRQHCAVRSLQRMRWAPPGYETVDVLALLSARTQPHSSASERGVFCKLFASHLAGNKLSSLRMSSRSGSRLGSRKSGIGDCSFVDASLKFLPPETEPLTADVGEDRRKPAYNPNTIASSKVQPLPSPHTEGDAPETRDGDTDLVCPFVGDASDPQSRDVR